MAGRQQCRHAVLANAFRDASSEGRQASTGKHSTQAAKQAEGRQTGKAGKQTVQGAGMQVGVEGHVTKLLPRRGSLRGALCNLSSTRGFLRTQDFGG